MLMSLWQFTKDTLSWKTIAETKTRNGRQEYRRRKDTGYPCTKSDLESKDDNEKMDKGAINAKVQNMDVVVVNLTKKLELVCKRLDQLDQTFAYK